MQRRVMINDIGNGVWDEFALGPLDGPSADYVDMMSTWEEDVGHAHLLEDMFFKKPTVNVRAQPANRDAVVLTDAVKKNIDRRVEQLMNSLPPREFQGVFVCPFPTCSLKWKKLLNLTTHIRSKVHEKEEPRDCNHCGEHLSSNVQVAEHLEKVLKFVRNRRRFICCNCSAKFQDPMDLSHHWWSHEHGGRKPFECPHCSRSYGQSYDLRKHLRTALEKEAMKDAQQ